MDKIALISDIHGNIPALKTVLNDIKQRGIKTIYCLGDLAGKGPHGDQAVDICRQACAGIVRGNWDEYLAGESDNPEFIWHQERLGKERRRFLQNLPDTIDLLISGQNIRLFHASQKSVHYRVLPHSDREALLNMFNNTDFTGLDAPLPDVVGYGDIHGVFMLPVETKILFNVGSVGNPLDQPTAAYAIIEGELESVRRTALSIQTIRLPYDIELAIKQARALDMPALKPYEDELRTARYRNLKS